MAVYINLSKTLKGFVPTPGQVYTQAGYLGSKRGLSTLSSYSVTESASPIDIADSSGSVGQISFVVQEDMANPNSGRVMIGSAVELRDTYRGTTSGEVSSVSSDNGLMSVSAVNRLGLLVADRTAKPFVGTLEATLRYYLSLANITTGIIVDASIGNINVALPGWKGDIWTQIKALSPVYGFDVALVSNNIVFRPQRANQVITYKDTTIGWSVQNSDLARSVEVNYYSNTYKVNQLVYPANGWNTDVQVFQVEANEEREEEIQVDVSILSLVQPQAVNNVTRTYAGPLSVYSVTGNDGLPIPAKQWKAQGGSITVSLGEDDKTIIVKLKGPTEKRYSPYSISVNSSTSNSYSTLRIVGTGVHFKKQSVIVPTGIDKSRTAIEVGITVENTAISTYQQAMHAGMSVAARYGTPMQVLNVSATALNKRGVSGSANYPTVAFVQALYQGMLVSDVEALWAGQTIKQMDEYFFDLVSSDFENQSFGNIAGARRRYGSAMYRIKDVTFSESMINYTAESDTLVSEVQSVFEGKTIEQVNAIFAGLSIEQVSVMPLG